MNENLDPNVVALARAIKQNETGAGDTYNAPTGADGEQGAYRFLPSTWKQWAGQHLSDENAPMTMENQNKVAYSQIKSWKDQGYNPGQIASLWNSGKPDPEGNVGVSKGGAAYDTPAYVKKVYADYQNFKGETQPATAQPDATQPDTGYQTTATLPAPTGEPQDIEKQQPGLGQNLSDRIHQISQSITDASTGKINWGSAALQSVGALAGGVGDITGKAFELIPGVKSLEQGIGNALGSLANTSAGQAVIGAAKDFAKVHPEIAGDLAATANIASVIPIFKGISLAKGALVDTAANAFEGKLSNIATQELTDATSRTIGGRNALQSASQRGIDPINTIVKNRFLPDVSVNSEGRHIYQTVDAYQSAKSALSQDEAQLQDLLGKASPETKPSLIAQGIKSTTAGGQVSLDQLRQETLAQASKELAGNPDYSRIIGRVNDDFDGLKSSIGERDLVSLQELNNMKRNVRQSVNFKSDNLDTNSRYLIGQQMMSKIEQVAEKQGIPGVRDLNKQMASKIEAMKILKSLNNKSVKLGKTGKIIKTVGADVAGGAGELAGKTMGFPFAGAIAGRQLGGLISSRAPGFATRLLGRTKQGGATKKALSGVGRIATPGLMQNISRDLNK